MDFTVAPIEGLTLGASYTYTKVTLSKAFNPFTNAQSVIYPLYVPKNAGAVNIDYQHPLGPATFEAHLDANQADGQYTGSTDPTFSDSTLVVNARVAISDIRLKDTGGDLQIAVWARNLLDEDHAFLRNTNASLGQYAIFNDPRTYGVEARLKF